MLKLHFRRRDIDIPLMKTGSKEQSLSWDFGQIFRKLGPFFRGRGLEDFRRAARNLSMQPQFSATVIDAA